MIHSVSLAMSYPMVRSKSWCSYSSTHKYPSHFRSCCPAGTKYCYKGHNGTECRNAELTPAQKIAKTHIIILFCTTVLEDCFHPHIYIYQSSRKTILHKKCHIFQSSRTKTNFHEKTSKRVLENWKTCFSNGFRTKKLKMCVFSTSPRPGIEKVLHIQYTQWAPRYRV